MAIVRQRRDNRLIDAIEAVEPVEFSGPVWRIVRDGRDPTRCSRSGGRWDDGTFDVLYTSLERDGAISEMKFHLMRGQPVMPSQILFKLFELEIAMGRALKLLDLDALQALGLDTARYGQLSWQEKAAEYPRSQDIAEAAHFLDYDGLIVPSARWGGLNAIVFCDRAGPDSISIKTDHGRVDWG
jgi:RES domain-containing protein